MKKPSKAATKATPKPAPEKLANPDLEISSIIAALNEVEAAGDTKEAIKAITAAKKLLEEKARGLRQRRKAEIEAEKDAREKRKAEREASKGKPAQCQETLKAVAQEAKADAGKAERTVKAVTKAIKQRSEAKGRKGLKKAA